MNHDLSKLGTATHNNSCWTTVTRALNTHSLSNLFLYPRAEASAQLCTSNDTVGLLGAAALVGEDVDRTHSGCSR